MVAVKTGVVNEVVVVKAVVEVGELYQATVVPAAGVAVNVVEVPEQMV